MVSTLRHDLPINHMGVAEQSAASASSATNSDQPVGKDDGALPHAGGGSMGPAQPV
jgi:hypothetical protein